MAREVSLPVDSAWYRAEQIDTRLWRITEPPVHPIWSANMHLVLGRDADLLIDSGMGVAPLRPFLDRLRPAPGKPLICLTTHSHIDHMGAVHEFEERLVHPIEAEEMAAPTTYSLRTVTIPERLKKTFADIGYPELWPLLIDAVPHTEYDVDSYTLKGAVATRLVEDGDLISLGDWTAEVLHLPGHAPGQVGLFHQSSGTLFGADAVYDGPLVYEGPGTDLGDYARTLRRLQNMPIRVVHGGHDPHFGKDRLDEMIAQYLPIFESAQ